MKPRHRLAVISILAVVFVFPILLVLASPVLATTPTHLWSRPFGGSGSSDGVTGVAVDPAGNVIVVGSFSATVNMGGSDLVSAGGGDIFVAKYSATGQHLWSKRFGAASSDGADAVAVDSNGNILVSGFFQLTVDFGAGGLTSAGSIDCFFAKFFPDGTLSVAKSFGSTSPDEGYGVAVDASNNLYLTGYFQGTVSFGGAALVGAGNIDVFVAKFTAGMTHIWSKGFGSTAADAANAIALDASANVVITGTFAGTINFGGSNLLNGGGNDVFVAKFDTGGTHIWSQRFGGASIDQANGLATDAAGNVLTSGYFTGTANFGGANLVSAGGTDGYVAKYSSAGVHQWSLRFGAANNDVANKAVADGAGNVLVTGFFNSAVDFGGGILTSAGFTDAMIVRYSPAGTHQWSRRIGGVGADQGNAVCVDAANRLILGGQFSNVVDFGNGPVEANGFNDAFVAEFSPNPAEPDITAITDIGNDQGRRVQIKFTASGGDDAKAANPITSYEAFRKQKAPPAAAAPGDAHPQLITGWTFVASVPAHQESDYTVEAPTIGDTTIPLGTYNSIFFIRAAGDGSLFYDSPPDSGASVDNLAPGVPGSLVYASGNLSWDQSKDEDFDYFTVYGANTSSFGAATLVNYSVAPGMNVSASPYVYYFVTATDFSGNEGRPAIVNSLSGVGGTPSSYVLSVSNYPNPFNPRTTVSYTVPSRGHVSVRVFDTHGEYVATLFDGERNAGAYSANWDGRAAGASVAASGVYFARIEHNGVTRTKKMVLLK
ncbi:MAG TPA: T9SS type A sorting domain-containing protein [Candidatus Krumholzibacteria bacterium]|nr:T9SS type A sorting domain-containing protein [Candidatus Krumholzibacteria bacterium]